MDTRNGYCMVGGGGGGGGPPRVTQSVSASSGVYTNTTKFSNNKPVEETVYLAAYTKKLPKKK